MHTSLKGALKEYTSFRVGGPADIHIPETVEDLKSLLAQFPYAYVLGGGTKILFPDEGIAVPVILTTSLKKVDLHGTELRAEAGVRLAPYFDFTTGVAVTVGGALHNNFGAFGYDIGSFVKKVRIISPTEDIWLDRRDVSFAYRTSSIREKKQLVAEAIFMKTQTTYKDTFLRQRKETQPLNLGCAGSIFKNPAGKHSGQLLEACGLKGTRDGDAEIWDKHANFIVNRGSATAANIKNLIIMMHQAVYKKFNIKLELELEVFGGVREIE